MINSYIERLLLLPKYILYKIFLFVLPVKNDVVAFEAYWGKGYSCNPKAISDFLESFDNIKRVWFFTQLPSEINEGIIPVKKFSLKYFYYLAVSGCFISNANHPNFFTKRKGVVFVQTKHGTPLKKMGIDELETKQSSESAYKALENRCNNWDYVISSNKFSTVQWKSSFPFDYKILETGYPRNDLLFNYSSADIEKVKENLGIDVSDSRKIILFMPTFREYHEKPEYYIDFNDLADKVSLEYIILVRAHYFNDGMSNIPSLPSVLDVTLYPNVEELYLITDVMVTDYSSSMFDYACLKRDTILYVPDYNEYSEKRGLNFDITADAPGLIVYNYEDLIKSLTEKSYNNADQKLQAKKFNLKFCNFDDGQASRRVAEQVFKYIITDIK
ncbi:CDP-glycerol glycerophosphotransferase family protein [Photobacterium lutimaris]|uniref:CDP-glycerol glycerophosphotransferase family protein n=1 Tax=Photobacterium lutimaris TaxID=388278 RepID=UPI0010EDEEF7|nr:CDP-glycerol glycerophosphotransferase family protein [Photobacterium lutimaris]TDR75276.1 CDP-glycerol glycerophosphotransferase (TagB/SpsB family) [Photobacterium lutimaris]